MATDFEKQLNDKMENVRLDEVMPGFDKEAAWNELSPRLKEKRSLHLFYRVLPYAAMLVLGVAIGKFLINRPVKELVYNTHTVIKTAEPIHDTVQLPAITNTKTIIKVVKRASKNDYPNQQFIQPTVNTPNPIQKEPVHDEQQTPVQEQIAANKAPKQRVKAVHLLDIENEDRSIAVNRQEAAPYRTGDFILSLVAKNLPDRTDNSAPPLLLNAH